MKKLYKSNTNKQICGVCGGLAEYFDIDVTLVRIITAVLIIAGGLSLWVYVIAAIIMPTEPSYDPYDADNQNNIYGE